MKYLVLADLHHDIWMEAGRDPFEGLESDIASLDLLLLAGDLSNKPKVRWTKSLNALAKIIPPEKIKIFPGNHDFYQYRIDAEDRLRDFADASGVDYVNRTAFCCGDTRFLCATLWTDFNLGPGRLINEAYIPTRINDFKQIRVAKDRFRPLLPRDVVQAHITDKNWLMQHLRQPHQGETIVVTHHAPHPAVLFDYAEDLDAAFASNLEDFIKEYAPTEWMFGHCHDAHDITVGSTRLTNVSLGYPDDIQDPAERIRSLIRKI
jgi:predicted phosphohydrolase